MEQTASDFVPARTDLTEATEPAVCGHPWHREMDPIRPRCPECAGVTLLYDPGSLPYADDPFYRMCVALALRSGFRPSSRRVYG